MDLRNQQPSPASRFAEYRAWLDQRWAEWRRINGLTTAERVTYAQHRAFDAWLAFRAEQSRLDPPRLVAASSAG